MSTPPLSVGVTRDRLTRVSAAARALHRRILQAFATTGHAPDWAEDLADPLLDELHQHDVINLDDNARIRAAYPFSAIPTPHTVAIQTGPTVYAMCAIDALGIAAMVGRDLAITSTDPWSGEPILVTIHGGQPRWRPAGIVVFVGSQGDCCAPAADRYCGLMNFFASKENATTWLGGRPGVTGEVLRGPQALELGVDIFGRLLDD